ncbi:hypothetical protein Tco_1448495 [Tanacetum coccineum]
MGNEDLNFVPNKELNKEILPLNSNPQESPKLERYDFPSGNDESILKEEVHEEALKSYLNPLFEKDEEIISNEASSKISPKFVKDNVEISHEVFKNDSENSLGIHDDKEEEIAFLDGLLEDENFFETNDKKVEFLERKTKEDCETKVESEKKKELQVFHPDIETLNHLGKIFDPGISHFDKDAFNDNKSSKELAPSKALLTLDVFDPLHPPLMNFNVTKAFFGFSGFWKLHGSNIVEGQSNSYNFHRWSPIFSS